MLSSSISVASDLAEVPALARTLKSVWQGMGLLDAETLRLELCVVEAVSNAIEHAYRGERGHLVHITTTLCGCTLVTEVRDHGVALDQRRLEQALSRDFDVSDLRSLPERGMGLAIMKEFMDVVTYESRPGDNTLTLTKMVTSPGERPLRRMP